MTTPITVTTLQVKSHSSPDVVRTPTKTWVEVVQLEGVTIGRFNCEPGWCWSECVKPVVKTDRCQLSPVGYAVSGRLTVRMKEGSEKTIVARRNRVRLARHDGVFTVLHSFGDFDNDADGISPYAGVTQGGAGNLYGTTPC
jgi:hypothetical protein